MNIREAKEQVKNAMIAYFTKDGDGEYKMPIEKQRPVFLMGPPGIGKTAIMEQIASEMGVGLLSYSMTHHTRQSALGLPFIEHKVYQGQSYDISEYTMSEIIASIYDLMEETGVKEGILFLDEINCVSETLAPIMLQFLQYKIFGRHRVPDGWIVVTAGNPPEYNNSVREFDIVTWDRLKRIDVEPDYEAWKAYAYEKHVHPAIVTYLEIKKADFYRIETTVDGKKFVTARGWDDLSQMMYLYEENHLPVDELLISQYLQNPRIAKNFAVYYDLYQKYQSDYQVDGILAGTVGDEIILRAKEAKFDERLSLLGMLLDALSGKSKTVIEKDLAANELVGLLREYKMMVARTEKSPGEWLEEMIERQRDNITQGSKAGSLSREAIARMKRVVKLLEQGSPKVQKALDGKEAFLVLKELLEESRAANKEEGSSVKANFEAVFSFLEEVFGDGQEMLILVTELTTNPYTANFIGKYGCEAYFKHNKDLLFSERQKEIMKALEDLSLS